LGTPIGAEAEIPAKGDSNGGGIIAFAKDGYLSSLEAYSVDVEPIRTSPPIDDLRFTVRR
jgi:hypothetical protein